MRLCGDLIQVYNIMRDMDNADGHSLLAWIGASNIRGYRFKV